MPSKAIKEIVEHIRNIPKMAFIVDTSFVFGVGSEYIEILNVDYEGDIREAAEHVKNVESLLSQDNKIIVPVEVRREINEGIDTFERVKKTIKRHNHRDQPKYSAVCKYTDTLRSFQERNEGRDPRFIRSIGNVRNIDADSIDYKNTWAHYHQEVFMRHRRKEKDPTIADIAINTLAYLIQKQGILPCILTRDNDFELIARSARAQTEEKKVTLKEGRLIYLSGNNFETSVYVPFSNKV